jgi:CBS domain-containing protein/uncharacterized protein (DUF2267 family)
MKPDLSPFIHEHVLVLTHQTAAKVAARAMKERRVGSAMICGDEGEMVGIITDRDLACELLAFDYPADTPLLEIMSTEIYSLEEDATVEDAVQLMKEYAVRRIPIYRVVRQGKRKCVGMISFDDVIAHQLASPEVISQIAQGQVIRPPIHLLNSFHSDERMEHTLNRFFKHMGLAMGLDSNQAEIVSMTVLRDIVLRLPSRGAGQFLSQLPKILREDLLDLPAGPDRSIDAQKILHDLCDTLGLSVDRVGEILQGFWKGLSSFVKSGEPKQVLHQLPPDVRGLFVEMKEEESQENIFRKEKEESRKRIQGN